MSKSKKWWKEYYEKNKSKLRDYQKSYYNTPHIKEKINSKRRNWRKIHRFRSLSKNLKDKLKTYISPIQLFGILKKQKMICPLTGRKITNDNISLDHIIPLNKGGLTEVKNLRFVINDINKAKGVLSDDELIKLCNDVVQHNLL